MAVSADCYLTEATGLALLTLRTDLVERMAHEIYEAKVWSDQVASIEVLRDAGFRMRDIVLLVDDARNLAFMTMEDEVAEVMGDAHV